MKTVKAPFIIRPVHLQRYKKDRKRHLAVFAMAGKRYDRSSLGSLFLSFPGRRGWVCASYISQHIGERWDDSTHLIIEGNTVQVYEQ